MSLEINKQQAAKGSLAKQRSYNEVVEFLDAHWVHESAIKSLDCVKKLDQALGCPAKNLKTIHIGGTNGKSLTIHFITRLMREEGLSIGSLYAPHILTYNERISLNNESVSNKTFTELANEVINAAQDANLKPNSLEILTMMALVHFKNNKVDIAVLEISVDGPWDPVNVCTPSVAAITRIDIENAQKATEKINTMLEIVKKDTWVISADQSKINLQIMHDIVQGKKGKWAMPIRKLATLAYPFEQLHGRCAALAERIAQLYIEEFTNKDAAFFNDSLLAKKKGLRGRPTLEAKRHSELNPKKTIEQFWKEISTTLPGRFQLLEKEKPTILLDNASNIDAIKNLLLGIRLLHYQRPLKGLTIIIGCKDAALDNEELLKLVRYFFKKTSGQIIFCPVEPTPGLKKDSVWDVEKITNDVKNVKVKARSAKNFVEAFEAAKKSVDERHGLVVITGCQSIISEYWTHKGIKKF